MDKCPKCDEYSLDFDVFEKKAICTHKKCSFTEKISEEDYIVKYSHPAKYAVIPSGIEERIKQRMGL